MKTVCVLGNGQLGRMLRQAGEPLGITVYPVGIEQLLAQIPYQNATITAEIEQWPETTLTKVLANQPQFINRDIFPIIADRQSQKQLLDTLQLSTSPWLALQSPQQWPTIFDKLGDFTVVKRRRGGYDGRGQWHIHPNTPLSLPEECYYSCIVEQGIQFSGEVSLVGARNRQGDCVFYPLTHNFHQQGILRASIAFPNPAPQLQHQAETMLACIMNHLNYIGVMAMECFIVGDKLLINELAPRVHNSGHWTQNGASISQFELHLRAITDLPMPQPMVDNTALMINLIGLEYQPQWLATALAHLHWYDKEVRQDRKLGHINLTHSQPNQLINALNQLATVLTESEQPCLNWLKNMLTNQINA